MMKCKKDLNYSLNGIGICGIKMKSQKYIFAVRQFMTMPIWVMPELTPILIYWLKP